MSNMVSEAFSLYEQLGKTLKRIDDEALTIKGRWTTWVWGPDGQLKFHAETDNIVVTAGKNAIAQILNTSNASPPVKPGWIALGTSTTAPAIGDTALGAEITTNGGARAAATGSTANNVLTLSSTFNITGNLSINELGLLNAASAGTLFTHAAQPNAPLNLASGDTLTQQVQLTFG